MGEMMARLSAKLRSVWRGEHGVGIAFWCPGCDESHVVGTRGRQPIWQWNESVDAPTFSPSIRVTSRRNGKDTCCHSFVEDGNIRFLGDCTHALAGQTVPLPDWPDTGYESDFYLAEPHASAVP
jgi:hypothetical protein